MKEAVFGTIIVLVAVFLITVSTILTTLNKEAISKNAVIAQMDVREAYFDKMWKVISQRTQVTNVAKETRLKMVEELVAGRPGGFVRIVHESNPESLFDMKEFESLANAIEANRNGFFREQKELISLYQQYSNLFDMQPSGFILSLFGREKQEKPIIISSSSSKEVMESGTEDDVKLEL